MDTMDTNDTAELEISSLRAEATPREKIDKAGRNSSSGNIIQRRVGAALSVLAVALIVVFAWREASGASSSILNTNTTLAPNAGTVYLEYGAPWGRAWLNGESLNAWQTESNWQALQLRVGLNHFVYVAPPFPPLRCTISAPASPNDTCPLITHFSAGDVIEDPSLGRILNLHATLNRLSPAQLHALIKTTDDALSTLQPPSEVFSLAPITLEPGDHYLDASNHIQVASHILYAALTLQVNTNPGRAIPEPLPYTPSATIPCVSFCPPTPTGDPLVHFVATWRYFSAPRAAPFAEGAFAATHLAGDAVESIMVRWNGRWQVSFIPFMWQAYADSLCAQALVPLSQQQRDFPFGGAAVGIPSMGCLFTATTDSGRPGAIFLLRCGVWTAINAAARQMALPFPDASPHELAIAANE